MLAMAVGDRLKHISLKKLKAATLEPVQHGAALGLGVASMGSGNMEAYEALKEKLFLEEAGDRRGGRFGYGSGYDGSSRPSN